jgi:hypothetical protein
MPLGRRTYGRQKILWVINHIPEMPMREVRVVTPLHTACVQKDTGTRHRQKLIDLATDIADIDVGCVCVSHIHQSV